MLPREANRPSRHITAALDETVPRTTTTHPESYSGVKRKGQRTARACDFCRLKKAKCDGEKPCKKCQGCKASCTYSHLRKSSRPQSILAYAATLARQQATLVECVETLHRRLRKQGEGESTGGAQSPEGSGPSVNEIILSLGLDPIDTADFDSEDNTNHSKSHPSPSISGSSPTTIKTSPLEDTLELQDTPESTQLSSYSSDSSLPEPVPSTQTFQNGDLSWRTGPQYCGTPLAEDDMFGGPSYPGDLTPRALNPWPRATSYDMASYTSSYDLFENFPIWNT